MATQQQINFANTYGEFIFKNAIANGIDPRALFAQLGMETGWGKSVQGFNLGNIKADANWRGATYTNPNVTSENNVFKSYANPEEAIKDYISLISNPNSSHYKGAWANRGNGQKYLQAIGNSGYSTDPNYGANLLSTYNGNFVQGWNPEQIYKAETPAPKNPYGNTLFGQYIGNASDNFTGMFNNLSNENKNRLANGYNDFANKYKTGNLTRADYDNYTNSEDGHYMNEAVQGLGINRDNLSTGNYFGDLWNGALDAVKQNPMGIVNTGLGLWNSYNQYKMQRNALDMQRDNLNFQKQQYADQKARQDEQYNLWKSARAGSGL